MKKQEILYTRIKLNNVPNGKDVKVSDDFSKIFYFDKGKRVIVKDLGINQKEFDKFISVKVSEESLNWYKVFLEIDVDCFLDTFRKSHQLRNRKRFFLLMKSCYWESIYNYQSHNSLNFFEDALDSSTDSQELDSPSRNCEDESLEWMASREEGINKEYYIHKNQSLKIGDVFINVDKGNFSNDISKKAIKIRGGVIIDSDEYFWIESLINMALSKRENKKYCHGEFPFHTDSNLILCDKDTIGIWFSKIKEIEKKLDTKITVEVISNKRDHYDKNYSSLTKADFVLLNFNYLTSKNYAQCYNEYVVNDSLELKNIFDTMRSEYKGVTGILSLTQPVLALIHWHRLVIDSDCLKLILDKKELWNHVKNLHSIYRWVQTKNLPSLGDDIKSYLEFLSNEDVEYPLYDRNDNICFVNKLVRKFTPRNHRVTTNPTVESKIITVKMFDFEEKIYNFYKNKTFKKFDEILSILDTVIAKSKTKTELITENLIKRSIISPESSKKQKFREINKFFTENSECLICLNRIKNQSITKCGHVFCTECITMNTLYNSTCPICRTGIDVEKIYRVTSSFNNKGSKINRLSKIIKNIDGNALIYIASRKVLSLVKESKPLSSELLICSGSYDKKREIIKRFNSMNELKKIVLHLDDHQMSKNVQGINNVIFLDTKSDMIKFSKNKLYGYDYLNGSVEKINIRFISFRGTKELRMIKNFLK